MFQGDSRQSVVSVTTSALSSSVEVVRLEVARRIVSGAFEPGMALNESELAAEFNVSRTPIREALRQLASSGLVEKRAHRKAVVTKPDDETLAGMFTVMSYLEALCAGLCAVNMPPTERRALERLHADMGAMVRAGDVVRYTAANEVFHNAVYDGARNVYLAEITRATRQRVQPFRRAQFGTLGRLAASHAEHTLVVEAILRGDRETADKAMKAHLNFVENAWYRFSHRFHEPEATKALQEP
jgi:DNA-binding GntR family transcriptional regulator